MPPRECREHHLDTQGAGKLALFRLFLLSATGYAHFAREFCNGKPYILADFLVGDQRIVLLGLNSCGALESYGGKAGAVGTITREERERVSGELSERYGNAAMRVALLHHPLIPRLTPGEAQGLTGGDEVRDWLHELGVSVVLLGHLHRDVEEELRTGVSRHPLILWHTGHSFPMPSDVSGVGDFSYEVLVFERPPSSGSLQKATCYRREFTFRTTANPGPGDVRCGPASNAPKSTVDIPTGTQETASPLHRFVFGTSDPKVRIIAHCDAEKFQRDPSTQTELPPGQKLATELNTIRPSFDPSRAGSVHVVRPGERVDLSLFDADAVFLVDSPAFNPYTGYVLDRYREFILGPRLTYTVKMGLEGPDHTWEVRTDEGLTERYISDKNRHHALVDAFTDYLVIVRLPNFLGRRDQDGVIWIIAGSHSKGSLNGARMFGDSWLSSLYRDARVRASDPADCFFEALYEVPSDVAKCEDFSYEKMRLLHSVPLAAPAPHGPSDELGLYVASRAAVAEYWEAICLRTVHFDPVAACNLKCPGCIEAEANRVGTYLPLSQCVRVFRQFRSLRCRDVRFCGGEPMTHPDFPALLDLAAACEFRIQVVTNGSLLQEPDIRDAVVRLQDRVELRVSVDADCAARYAEHHGISAEGKVFDGVVQGIEELLQCGVTVGVSYLVDESSTPDEVQSFYERWSKPESGASYVAFRPATGIGGTALRGVTSETVARVSEIVTADPRQVKFPSWLDARSWKPIYPAPSYDTCYSQLYRVVVSPGETTHGEQDRLRGGVVAGRTDKIWISRCAYRRYARGFGEEMDAGFFEYWWRECRVQGASEIEPSLQCQDVVCNRNAANRLVGQQLAASSASNRPGSDTGRATGCG